MVYASEFRDAVAQIRHKLPGVTTWIEVSEDGRTAEFAEPFEALTAEGDGAPLSIKRAGDDLLFIYTGGTTGMPKGVMWPHHDLREITLQAARNVQVDLGLVTQTLRDSLDQLKLSVDALTLAPGDVVGLLASLRFRIAPRLKAAGLELIWDVHDLPTWPDGQPPALRQLQYILFEGLSNVLQHSGASHLTLSARQRDGAIEVCLQDDGLGWRGDVEGSGIQTMKARAKVIGAQLNLRGEPGRGTELRVVLPLRSDRQLDLSSAA